MSALAEPPSTLVPCIRMLRQLRYEDVLRAMLQDDADELREKFARLDNKAWYIVGDCYFRLRRYDKASGAFLKSAQAHARDGYFDRDAVFAFGNCLSESGRPEQAVLAYATLCFLNEHDHEAAFNCGNAYFDMGSYDKAIDFFKMALAGGGALALRARKNIRLSRTKARSTKSKET